MVREDPAGRLGEGEKTNVGVQRVQKGTKGAYNMTNKGEGGQQRSHCGTERRRVEENGGELGKEKGGSARKGWSRGDGVKLRL